MGIHIYEKKHSNNTNLAALLVAFALSSILGGLATLFLHSMLPGFGVMQFLYIPIGVAVINILSMVGYHVMVR